MSQSGKDTCSTRKIAETKKKWKLSKVEKKNVCVFRFFNGSVLPDDVLHAAHRYDEEDTKLMYEGIVEERKERELLEERKRRDNLELEKLRIEAQIGL
ncbi:hypothetical protein TNCV_3918341 [Trichonephila clavipes]|nr:hypothetical protein TNCV_3918341 [Trichonephila clavipes]